jgi:hypothetical protein
VVGLPVFWVDRVRARGRWRGTSPRPTAPSGIVGAGGFGGPSRGPPCSQITPSPLRRARSSGPSFSQS